MSKTAPNEITKLNFSCPHQLTGQNWVHRGAKMYFSLTMKCIPPDRKQVLYVKTIKITNKPQIPTKLNIYMYM